MHAVHGHVNQLQLNRPWRKVNRKDEKTKENKLMNIDKRLI